MLYGEIFYATTIELSTKPCELMWIVKCAMCTDQTHRFIELSQEMLYNFNTDWKKVFPKNSSDDKCVPCFPAPELNFGYVIKKIEEQNITWVNRALYLSHDFTQFNLLYMNKSRWFAKIPQLQFDQSNIRKRTFNI